MLCSSIFIIPQLQYLCQIITSLVHISGELYFVNNSGGDESALHMLSFAQVVLSKQLFVSFEGNSGRSVGFLSSPWYQLTCKPISSLC